MKKFLPALLGLGLLMLVAVPAPAETDYPSEPTLRKLMTRVERIAAQLDRLEAAVALIPTAS